MKTTAIVTKIEGYHLSSCKKYRQDRTYMRSLCEHSQYWNTLFMIIIWRRSL